MLYGCYFFASFVFFFFFNDTASTEIYTLSLHDALPISFTIISILAGCLTSYYIGFSQGGPVAITWGWLIVGGFCIFVSLALGEIASTYPTAGGLYFWSSKLGTPGWGWFTGWFNLIGQIAVTAAIDFGAATFISSLMNLWFSFSLSKGHVFLVYTVIIAL